MQALQHTAGFLRTELSHRLDLYSVPQLHFVYDDSIEAGHAAVAADRRGGRRGPQAAVLMPRRRSPGARGGGSTACCCSTSRRACRRTRRCSARSGCSRAEKAGHTGTLDPLASGLLPLCFGEATKFAQCLLDARKALHRHGPLRDRHDDRRRRGRGQSPKCRSTFTRGRPRRGAAAVRRDRSRRCRRATRRSSSRAAATTSTRAPGIEIPRVAREVEIDALDARRLDAAGRRCCASPAARAPTSACSPRTSAAALGCGAHLAALRRTRDRAVRAGRRGHARRARGDGRRRPRRAAAAASHAPLADLPVASTLRRARPAKRVGPASGRAAGRAGARQPDGACASCSPTAHVPGRRDVAAGVRRGRAAPWSSAARRPEAAEPA